MKKREGKASKPPVVGRCRMELIGGGRERILRLEGTRKILLCTEECIKVADNREIVCVEGEKLLCLTYATGAVEISGGIARLSFLINRGQGGESIAD